MFAVVSAGRAFAADDAERTAVPAWPTTYIDLRTNYATVPANSFSIGFGMDQIMQWRDKRQSFESRVARAANRSVSRSRRWTTIEFTTPATSWTPISAPTMPRILG